MESTQPKSKFRHGLRILGEVLSQLLNVPFLSGALVTFVFFNLPTDIPNRLKGFGWAMLFISLIPLGSLLFYIPGKSKNWPAVVKRQRYASFILMMISYPIGFIVLRLVNAPRIFEAIAVNYTLITLGLIIFNLILRYKASGHAAGVAGPVAAMFYFFGLTAAPLLLFIPLTIFARIAAKGHDIWQLAIGSILSISITFVVLYLYGFNLFGQLL
ncbi:MAG: hypothetical protein MUP11_10530 [Anaerolineales bacterium]|nr:hypothetical protein [Anaerolineales bacterium]